MTRDEIKDLYAEAYNFKHEINSKIQQWLNEFRGEKYGNEIKNRSSIVWKIIKKQTITLQANLIRPFVVGSSIVELIPVSKNDVIKSKIDEKILNYFWEKDFDKNSFMNTLTGVMIKEGTSFIYVSWDYEEKVNKQTIRVYDPKALEPFINAGAEVNKISDNEYEIIFRKKIKNRPHAQVIPNEDIFTDPTASSISESRFIIVRYPTTKDELLSNPLYDKEIVNKFINENSDSMTYESGEDLHNRQLYRSSFEFNIDKSSRRLFVYEFWYKKNNEVNIIFFLSNSPNDITIIGKKKYDFNFYPFVSVPFFENEFSIWGDSLAEIISDEQKFMTSIVRGVIDNMSNSNNGQKFVRKGALDSINMRRLIEGYPIVEINATGYPIQQLIMDGSFNELPSSVYNMLQIIENHSEGLTGVTRTIAGVSGSELNAPATNFTAMMNQAQVRLLIFTTNLQQALKKMFLMWLEMSMKYLSDDDIYEITGISIPEIKAKETKRLIEKYGIDELPEDTKQKAMLLIVDEINNMFDKNTIKYDFNFKVGTDGLKAIKINQINMLMQQAAQLVTANICPPSVIQKLLAKLAELMEFHDIADEIKEYKPQPNELEIQMAQLEMLMKKAKADKEEALAKNALARTQSTLVKAKKEELSIDADLSTKYAELLERIKKLEQQRNANDIQRDVRKST